MSPGQRLARFLRRSLTARITLSIVFVALLLVGAYGALLDHLVADELSDQNDLRLLTTATFLSQDVAQGPQGAAGLQRRLDEIQLRERMRASLRDAEGRTWETPQAVAMPADMLPPEPLDATRLPPDAALPALRAIRATADRAIVDWTSADGRDWRVLRARIGRATVGSGMAGPVEMLLAVEQSKTAEVRRGEAARLASALAFTALIAAALGVMLARSLLVDARRMGEASARIGAQALHERLWLEDVPLELEASARAFNHMLDRLEASFERLSRFSAEVAHDLRTPIGNLLGEAQVALSRARTPAEYALVLESAVEEYERMSRMIGNMLFLARADNAQTVVDLQPVSVEALLRRVTAYFEYVAEERQVALLAGVESPAAASLRIDESLVTRALGNLVANALRFAPPGSAVTVRAAQGGGGVAISVSNVGPAIPREHLDRIFERFFRVEASRQGSGSGSGLGLAIVRSVMELHGGSVAVATGATTTFTLNFPAPQGA